MQELKYKKYLIAAWFAKLLSIVTLLISVPLIFVSVELFVQLFSNRDTSNARILFWIITVATVSVSIISYRANKVLKKKAAEGGVLPIRKRILLDIDQLSGGWLVSNDEALQFSALELNNASRSFVFTDAQSNTLKTVPFESIVRIKIPLNARLPLFYFFVGEQKYTVGFTGSYKSIAKFQRIAYPAKVLALGEIGAIAGSLDMTKSSYSQVYNVDTLEELHGWLRAHKVVAYNQTFSRNVAVPLLAGLSAVAFLLVLWVIETISGK